MSEIPDINHDIYKRAGRPPFFPFGAFVGIVDLVGLTFRDGKDPETGLQDGQPAFFATVEVVESNREDIPVGMAYCKYFPYTPAKADAFLVQKLNRLLASTFGIEPTDPRFNANTIAKACIAETTEETLRVRLRLTSADRVSKKSGKTYTEDSWAKL